MKGASRELWPAPLVIPPQTLHTHTFILLHGLGSNGEKFGNELLESGVSSQKKTLRDVFPGAKFIFPTAKWRRSTAFNRAMLTHWFDTYSLDDRSLRADLQIEGLVESAKYIRTMLDQEMREVPTHNIVLGGLSQGCAMSLMVLLSLEAPIGAYVGMSGWLPFCRDIQGLLSDSTALDENDPFGGDGAIEQPPTTQVMVFVRDLLEIEAEGELSTALGTPATPVFLGHGSKDDKVPYRLGKQAANALSLLGMQVVWKGYPELGHWYQVPEEIDDIVEFLAGVWPE